MLFCFVSFCLVCFVFCVLCLCLCFVFVFLFLFLLCLFVCLFVFVCLFGWLVGLFVCVVVGGSGGGVVVAEISSAVKVEQEQAKAQNAHNARQFGQHTSHHGL